VHANDLTGVRRDSGTQRRGIVSGEPVQRAPQTRIGAQISGDAPASDVFTRRVLTVLGHHRPVTRAEARSMQDHGRGCRSDAHLVASGRIVCISPGRSPDPQVVSRSVTSLSAACRWCHPPCWTLRSHIPRFLSIHCGLWVTTSIISLWFLP
jgi:hypothetical protein